MTDLLADPSGRCPICNGQQHGRILRIEGVPTLCNLLLPTNNEALNVAKGDIDLHFCRTCGHIFNAAFDPQLIDYTQAYETSLHYSPRFQAYARSLVKKLVEEHSLYEKDVIEIGCGKGDFLKLLCEVGDNRGVGFDPSYEETRNGIAGDTRRFDVIRDLYTDKHAHYSADLIVCRQVLEHVDEPRVMVETVRRAIGARSETVVFFEVPNVLYTIRDLGIWDLIYEHCGYFSEPSLTHLFAACGLNPISVAETFGGQYLCLEAVPDNDPDPQRSQSRPSEVEALARHAQRFSESYREIVAEWEQRLQRLCADDRVVVVWGAGSKGITFLNTIRSSVCIDYIVDINPHKHGLYVPGTGQRVVAPNFLKTCGADVILVMNPLYSDEIRRAAAQMKLGAEILEV